MKKLFVILFSAGVLFSPTLFAQNLSELDDLNVNNNTLTGDVRLACEAILCLSSSVHPVQCAPSIARYYSIVHKKWYKTVKARLDFLNLCPVVGQNVKMKNLVSAITNGVGRCDPDSLNRDLARHFRIQRCLVAGRPFNDYDACTISMVTVISNQKPSYCASLESHEFIRYDDAVYVGDSNSGGYWVHRSNYDDEFKRYNQKKTPICPQGYRCSVVNNW